MCKWQGHVSCAHTPQRMCPCVTVYSYHHPMRPNSFAWELQVRQFAWGDRGCSNDAAAPCANVLSFTYTLECHQTAVTVVVRVAECPAGDDDHCNEEEHEAHEGHCGDAYTHIHT